MDEWVAYARNLVSNATLPAGTFDSQVSFAQALTEAVKQGLLQRVFGRR